MKRVYIFQNLNRTAPNTVMMHLISQLNVKPAKVISLNTSGNDNYKNMLREQNIEVVEFSGFLQALRHIFGMVRQFGEGVLIHANGYQPNVFGYLMKKIRRSSFLIATCHSVEDEEIRSFNFHGIKKAKNHMKLLIHRYLYPRFDQVVAVSYAVEKYLESIGCENVMVIYNGVPYQKDIRIDAKNTLQTQIDLCQVGLVSRVKNQLFTIKLLKYLKDKGLRVKVHFFGDYGFQEDYYRSVCECIEKHGLEKEVVFYGNLQFEALFEQLKQMDLLMMPSLSEGLPLGLLEAFNFELAAIVSRHGGMKEIVKDYENGLVVDIEDDKDFDKIYAYILSEQYIKNGIYAKKTAIKNYSVEAMAANYLKVYERF